MAQDVFKAVILGVEPWTGLGLLGNLAVISELKVTASQGDGVSPAEVARDAYKLSMLLEEYTVTFPGAPVPVAYSCLLDNHPRKVFSRGVLESALASTPCHPDVVSLYRRSTPKASMAP